MEFLAREANVKLRIMSGHLNRHSFDWYSPLQNDLREFDVCLTRGVIYSPKWNRVRNDTLIVSERHIARKPESRKDTIRVVAEKLAGSPRKFCSGFIYPTNELQIIDAVQQPSVVIGNCYVGTAATELRNPIRNRVGIAIGSLAKWNGLEKVFKMSKALPGIQFTLAMPEELHKTFTQKYDLADRERLRIVLNRNQEQYLSELLTWQAALGPMSMNAAGLAEAAPLKIRDAIRFGIPVFLNYVDTNLSHSQDRAVKTYVHEFDQSFIDTFYEWVCSIENICAKPETIKRVSPEVVDDMRLNFLKQLLSS